MDYTKDLGFICCIDSNYWKNAGHTGIHSHLMKVIDLKQQQYLCPQRKDTHATTAYSYPTPLHRKMMRTTSHVQDSASVTKDSKDAVIHQSY